jgi:hypothetical protein
MEVATIHPILGTSWSSFGALLIVVGAVLLLGDAAAGPSGLTGLSWAGTAPRPERRLAAAVALVGSVLVLAGSIVLVAVAGVSWLAVAVVLAVAAVMVVGVMASYLHAHLSLVARDNADAPRRSWWWCLWHPLWRPPPR